VCQERHTGSLCPRDTVVQQPFYQVLQHHRLADTAWPDQHYRTAHPDFQSQTAKVREVGTSRPGSFLRIDAGTGTPPGVSDPSLRCTSRTGISSCDAISSVPDAYSCQIKHEF